MIFKKIVKKFGMRKLLVLFSDLMALVISATIVLLGKALGQDERIIDYLTIENMLLFLVILSFSIFVFRFLNLYKQRIFTSGIYQIKLILRGYLYVVFVVIMLHSIIVIDAFNILDKKTIILFVAISLIVLIVNRVLLLPRIRSYLKRTDIYKRRVIIVGAGELGRQLETKIYSNEKLEFNLLGFVDDDVSLDIKKTINGSLLGTTSELKDIVAENDVDEIFLAINSLNHEGILNVFEKCKETNCQINMLSSHFSIIETKLKQAEINTIKYVRFYNNTHSVYAKYLKRIFDVIVASLLVLILSPFFFILMILIKVTSEGPVFYTPFSVGKNGTPFKFYKFRSMYNDNKNESHKRLVQRFIDGQIVGAKLRNDPRITRLGKFIRKYSIDEFAQLINVIKGEMSLVGPRPSTVYEYELMKDWHRRRYSILPGMTGFWQVYGRAEVSFTEMIMMDLYYIENCSLWLDLVILINTLNVVFKAKGGY